MAAAASRAAPRPTPTPPAPTPTQDAPAAADARRREQSAQASPPAPARPPRRSAPRITPVKATFDLDPADLRQVKAWAGRRLLRVAPVVRALLTELTTDEATSRRVAALLPDAPRPANPVKTTFDLDPPLYGDLRAWAAEHDTTNAAPVRLLLALLLQDPDLAARVEARAPDL